MKQIDLLIKGQRIYVDGQLIAGALAVHGGKIVGIFQEQIQLEAEDVLEAGDHLVLPGLVDPHVHLRDPGHPERESFKTGTMAAAAGGVTTICEHPISLPPPYSREILRRRREVARDQAVVDYAFFGAAGFEFLEEIIPLAEEGIVAYKTFLHAADPGREEEFAGLTMKDDGEVLQGFQRIKKTGLLCVIHAENNAIIQSLIKGLTREGKTSSIYHARSRPPISETETVSRMIYFAETTGVSIQIAHISLPETVELIAKAKRRGLEVYAETCPHYLFLNEAHLERFGPYAKCNPPLRTEDANRGLLEQVRGGDIDFIGSDHGPFLAEEKARGVENIFASPAGMPGLEFTLPLLMTQVKRGGLSLPKMMEMISENPAKIYGLYPQKGVIKIGSDADLVIVEEEHPFSINRKDLFTKAKDTALVYHGWEAYGRVQRTIVRGKTVFLNGSIMPATPGWGRFVSPAR